MPLDANKVSVSVSLIFWTFIRMRKIIAHTLQSTRALGTSCRMAQLASRVRSVRSLYIAGQPPPLPACYGAELLDSIKDNTYSGQETGSDLLAIFVLRYSTILPRAHGLCWELCSQLLSCCVLASTRLAVIEAGSLVRHDHARARLTRHQDIPQ